VKKEVKGRGKEVGVRERGVKEELKNSSMGRKKDNELQKIDLLQKEEKEEENNKERG
jgi:hypothetical protein